MTTRDKAKSAPARSGAARAAARGHEHKKSGAPKRGGGANASARGGTSARPRSALGVAVLGDPTSRSGARDAGSAPPRALLKLYHAAVRRSRAAGRPVSVRFVVDPSGTTTVPDEARVEDEAPPRVEPRGDVRTARPSPAREPYPVEEPAAPDAALRAALDAARARGQRRAAEILAGDDMLSAEQFAALIGTSRVTVNTRRQRREVLALDGAKRGFRFPAWQVDGEGKPFAAIPALFDRLGGSAWAVYRFLVQPHPELDGLTGRAALERGASEQAVEAAESVARDFR